MSNTRNSRDIKKQKNAQPVLQQHSFHSYWSWAKYGLPEEGTTPSVAEKTSGARWKTRKKWLKNVFKWSRDNLRNKKTTISLLQLKLALDLTLMKICIILKFIKHLLYFRVFIFLFKFLTISFVFYLLILF